VADSGPPAVTDIAGNAQPESDLPSRRIPSLSGIPLFIPLSISFRPANQLPWKAKSKKSLFLAIAV
jgi:hypothetical protein